MSNPIIRSELETRLKTWADAQTPKVPIAFEGIAFSKPTGPFLEPLLFPNIVSDTTLAGDRQTYRGIFEVRCWCPSGRGMGAVERMASNIASLFPLLPKTGKVSVENTPYTERPQLDEAGWTIVPVMIMYRYES